MAKKKAAVAEPKGESIKPHEYTTDEARTLFLRQVWSCIDYWENEARAKSSKRKLEGLAHSLMVILDGGSAVLPGFAVVPVPHPSDKGYHEDRGESWFKPCSGVAGDIGGCLHEHLYDVKVRVVQCDFCCASTEGPEGANRPLGIYQCVGCGKDCCNEHSGDWCEDAVICKECAAKGLHFPNEHSTRLQDKDGKPVMWKNGGGHA